MVGNETEPEKSGELRRTDHPFLAGVENLPYGSYGTTC